MSCSLARDELIFHSYRYDWNRSQRERFVRAEIKVKLPLEFSVQFFSFAVTKVKGLTDLSDKAKVGDKAEITAKRNRGPTTSNERPGSSNGKHTSVKVGKNLEKSAVRLILISFVIVKPWNVRIVCESASKCLELIRFVRRMNKLYSCEFSHRNLRSIFTLLNNIYNICYQTRVVFPTGHFYFLSQRFSLVGFKIIVDKRFLISAFSWWK